MYSECERQVVQYHEQGNGIAKIVLHKPETGNAFDEKVIAALRQLLAKALASPEVRVIILAAEGKHFSTGADLQWMKKAKQFSEEENIADAQQLSALMRDLYHCSKPVIAQVQGACYGGALGLVACSDIVVASTAAKFCLSEVKLGLVPAVISPYVHMALGSRLARRYMLTAELIPLQRALAAGLIHELVSAQELQPTVESIAVHLLQNRPLAVAETKKIANALTEFQFQQPSAAQLAETIAKIRVGTEAQQGLSDFFAKQSL